MRRVVLSVVAASSLLALPALTSSAPAAPTAPTTPAVAAAGDGDLTICFEGLGRHGKVNPGMSIEGLESGRATSSAIIGYVRMPACLTEHAEERTRFSFGFPAADPYRLRAVRSTQVDGEGATVTVTRHMGVRVVMDEHDDVRVTLRYGKVRR